MDNAAQARRRMVIVSNRLPFTVTNEHARLEFKPSAGGLVSGMSAYLERLRTEAGDQPDYLWIGWPGSPALDEQQQHEVRTRAAALHAEPVFISPDEMERFYHGFCNETIWPLFHYFPSYTAFKEQDWAVYQHVNRLFADAVLAQLQPGDTVWIHDYHLMLLPRLVRQRAPEAAIGFFLHIPFPTYEIFRLLPHEWSAAILDGLLGADLLGFHTYDYSRYFARAALRTLGHESHLGRILVGERRVRVATFPMSIDYAAFNTAPQTPAAQAELASLRERLADLKVVLSIDRLDYSKGLINRLEGYQAFLSGHPEWRGRVVLALVIIPSRVGVNEYQQTRTSIEKLVGRINGQFGSIAWTPILYQFRSLSFPELVALYASSDVALITPLRDGMNLIAKEYVASKRDGAGVLILSELTGAATELGEALQIMPTSREEIAAALRQALEMPLPEQLRRMRLMQERLARYDVVAWAADFVGCLDEVKREQAASPTLELAGAERARLLEAYSRAERRLLFLDYDGTLVPFAPRPDGAAPGVAVLRLLHALAADPANEVVIVSGRDRATLDRWLGAAPLTIVAEHGTWIKPRGGEWRLAQALIEDWKVQLRPLLERYSQRLPGALVEEKSFSLAWHYRQADPQLAAARAKELLDLLLALTGNLDVQVLQGKQVIEVRPTAVSKAMVARSWALEGGADFIMGIGDDLTDEDLFAVLPPDAHTIKVGPGPSAARLRLAGQPEVLELLAGLANRQAAGAAQVGSYGAALQPESG